MKWSLGFPPDLIPALMSLWSTMDPVTWSTRSDSDVGEFLNIRSSIRCSALFVSANWVSPSHQTGTFYLTPLSTRLFLPGNLPSISMILKNISNSDYALLQRVCHDQWHLQKCYGRLRALEVISSPPDRETFGKLVFELVSGMSKFFVNIKNK